MAKEVPELVDNDGAALGAVELVARPGTWPDRGAVIRAFSRATPRANPSTEKPCPQSIAGANEESKLIVSDPRILFRIYLGPGL